MIERRYRWVSASHPPAQDYQELCLLWVERRYPDGSPEHPTLDFGFHDDRGWHCRMDQRYQCTVTHWTARPPSPDDPDFC